MSKEEFSLEAIFLNFGVELNLTRLPILTKSQVMSLPWIGVDQFENKFCKTFIKMQ